jgi:hypothetical protein
MRKALYPMSMLALLFAATLRRRSPSESAFNPDKSWQKVGDTEP